MTGARQTPLSACRVPVQPPEQCVAWLPLLSGGVHRCCTCRQGHVACNTKLIRSVCAGGERMRSVAIVWPKCKIYSFKRVPPCLVFVVLTAVGTAAHFAGTPGYARPGAPPLSHFQHPTCRSCTETALTMRNAWVPCRCHCKVLCY